MSLTERMSVEKEKKKKEEEEEELKDKGKRGEEEEKKEEKAGKKKMRIKKKRRRKQRGGWGKVQSLNPGSPKFRDHRNEEKAAQSIKSVLRVSEGKLGDVFWNPS